MRGLGIVRNADFPKEKVHGGISCTVSGVTVSPRSKVRQNGHCIGAFCTLFASRLLLEIHAGVEHGSMVGVAFDLFRPLD